MVLTNQGIYTFKTTNTNYEKIFCRTYRNVLAGILWMW